MKNFYQPTAPASSHARKHLFFIFSIIFLGIATARAQVTNNALQFNGSNAYVNLGIVNPANNFSTGLTFEAWVKWDAFNNWSRILDLGNGSSSDNLIFANQGTSNQLRFEVYRNGSTQGITSPQAMVTGRWYHVAVTQTGAGLTTLYVDGIQVTSGSVQIPANVSRAQSYIGRSAWAGDGYLQGSVDEVRIWNQARSATEIRQNMLKPVATNAPGLVAYYTANETSGSVLSNTATNGGAGAGTLINNSRVASPVQQTSNALALDGNDDVVSIGSPLAANSSYTKEAWVYLTKDAALPQNIVSSNAAPFWISDGLLRAGNTGAANPVTDPTPFPLATWVHVAVSYDAVSQILNLYRNGVLVQSGTVSTPYQQQNIYLGAWHNGSANESFLGGQIDEVRIWNVARTGAEIAANMNREIDAAAEPALVSRFSFNQGAAGGNNAGLTTIPCQKSLTNALAINMALSGTTSNFVTQKSGLVVLPVRLLAFTAHKRNTATLLQWSTATEQNASRFVIQHSTDAKQWATIDEVAASGNSTTVRQYSYVHNTPVKGPNYYRLLLVDTDGESRHSPVVLLTFGETGKSFTVLQTTVTNSLLQVIVHTRTTLSLFTQEGRMIWSRELPAGTHSVPVNTVAKGIHYLSGNGSTEMIVIR